MATLAIALSFFCAIGIAKGESCREDLDSKRKSLLELDYASFDQAPPSEGWRAFEDKGCNIELARLLDSYLSRHARELLPDQKATLVFHSGQLYAEQGDTKNALTRMKKAFDPKLDQKYHWNSYVEGTIAFLETDLEKLKKARDRIQSAERDHPYVSTLSDFIECFGQSYSKRRNCAKDHRTP